MPVVTVSSKGQVVIPREVRERVGIAEGTRVQVEAVRGTVMLKPLNATRRGWRRWRGAFVGKRLLAALAREHRYEIAADRRVRS